ncbi:MAG: hypothetical protein EBZ77_13195 [Chitinophagia bacterium]|nr:hypothetical protein [Chitinophagia bacterium]
MVHFLLFFPVFDALRVFTARMLNRESPLKGDRRHLHYYLLDAGFSHAQAAWLLLLAQAITSIIAFLFQDSSVWLALPVIALPTIVISIIAARMRLTDSALLQK